MKTNEITAKEIFTDFLNSVKYGDYSDIRESIIKECRITPQIFRHWKNGNSSIPILAQEKINTIAKTKGFNTLFKLS